MAKRENEYQAKLIKKLKLIFPGCYIEKLNANRLQGVPDLLILYRDRWATLECKRSANASRRPNQEYHVNAMNEMSFSRFIFPENEEEVLHELELALKA